MSSSSLPTTARLYSGGDAIGLPLTLKTSATGRPVTGYVGWTFKTNGNTPVPELGVGLTPKTDTHIADGAIEAIRSAKPDRPLFLHVNFTAPHDPLHYGWKLIWYPKARRTQLFLVARDPDELHDLSAVPARADRLRTMARSLRAWLRDHGDPQGTE